ncbi:GDCCVxC domain-containing (seleno)protein [Pseudomonas sp. D(2018)]|uniref:GDCCVxC domain-containing (seleno)protein n=1 Tax=Pseudomonas sp. D(2018) TaxID=2502238 RepID=UPI0010F72AD5|nr:GDCCVxC domain-containing (seleno)protein [Pseudomonas sp. D(2018)]
MHGITYDSDLTCPNCGFTMQVRMPTDACLYFHKCSHCKALMRPKPGDCCVFCSYGSVPCPPRQRQTRPPTQSKD